MKHFQPQRIDEATQQRLSALMARNNDGDLTAVERRELEELGERAERLSMENAIVAGMRKK